MRFPLQGAHSALEKGRRARQYGPQLGRMLLKEGIKQAGMKVMVIDTGQ